MDHRKERRIFRVKNESPEPRNPLQTSTLKKKCHN